MLHANTCPAHLRRLDPPLSNLSPPLSYTLSGLRKKGDILILPGYKGRATVVVDKVNNDAKMLLGDNRTYNVELE